MVDKERSVIVAGEKIELGQDIGDDFSAKPDETKRVRTQIWKLNAGRSLSRVLV